jgi:S-formylglutathione hydrolase FrmB
VAIAAVAAALLAAAAPPAAGAAASPIRVLEAQRLDPRLEELTLATPALPAPTKVRVLLPDGYDAAAGRRYPVLYLLHGASGNHADWTTKGDARAATAGLDLIVVMPDGGRGGWYTDWLRAGTRGRPRWETYHVGQLIPFIDARYRTVAARAGRAIAGLSMGGFGTMSYAARHPDVFAAASAWSGAVDTNTPAGQVVDLVAGSDGGLPGSVFGLRQTDEVRWRGHNPWDLAGNLRGLTLALHTGDGRPGGPYGGAFQDLIESSVHPMNVNLHRRLTRLGIAHVFDDYGPGDHTWPYWNRDLRADLPAMMATFARRPRTPARVDFRAVEPEYRIFGWHVAIKRRVLEFSALRNARRAGFRLTGSGTATVTTPPRYRPRAVYAVRTRDLVARVRADRRGRLRLRVRIGPSNTVQQYATPAAEAARKTHRVVVRIRRAR